MAMSNTQVAHVWNAQSKREGKSNNGNFYFEGRTLFSYGSHFVVGYIMPDGLALLNGNSYSISTSGHQSDARRAVSDRRHATVSDLTDLAGYYKPVDRLARWIADGKPQGERAAVRRAIKSALVEYATQLATDIYAPGASRCQWDSEAGRIVEHRGEVEVGAYLAALVGLPAATWPKAKRDAERKAKRDKANREASTRRQEEARALQLADMSDRRFREWAADLAADYNGEQRLVYLRREFIRARGLMLKAKRGKLAAAGRLATVRARIKRLTDMIATHDAQSDRRSEAKSARLRLAHVRNWRDASTAARMSASWATMRDVASAAEWLSLHGRTAKFRATMAELAHLAHIGRDAIEAENARQRALEAEREKLREEERRELWLKGERVGRIYFDAESGGAAMRVIGDVLETSHGASVPLAHAVKAFRFIKLCREKGETFHRNGRTIRVGHFQVDSIDSEGNFRAGCHSFTWPEIERVAIAAGVFDCPASADAIEPSAHAA